MQLRFPNEISTQQLPKDSKNNIVLVTLFESYLGQFLLENTHFYKEIYFKILDAISDFIAKNRQTISHQRFVSNLFFEIGKEYPSCNSFERLKINFSLIAAHIFTKTCNEAFLNFKNTDVFQESKLSTL